MQLQMTPKPQASAGIAGFHGVRYLVTDVQRAIVFYTTHLGFTLEHQHLPAFATVGLGPLKIHLSGPGASSAAAGARWAPRTRRLQPRCASGQRSSRSDRAPAERRTAVSQ